MVNNETAERILKLIIFIKVQPHDLTTEEIRQTADELYSWLKAYHIKDEPESE